MGFIDEWFITKIIYNNMKIKRYDNLNEAKKPSTKECENLAKDLLAKEIKKTAMSRVDMINFIETCKEIKCENDEKKKVSRTAADALIHDPLKKKLGVEAETYINDKKKFNMAYFFIGKDAKMPDLKKLNDKKEPTKKNESVMITKFEKFNENATTKVVETKETKVEEANKPGVELDEVSNKVLNYMKDACCGVSPLRLKTALGGVSYKDVKNVLTKAQKDGIVVKDKEGKFVMKGPK